MDSTVRKHIRNTPRLCLGEMSDRIAHGLFEALQRVLNHIDKTLVQEARAY